ncbi:MAG: flagellar basal body protein [Defluviitaleaceae bacterium]|nr:flagellar basal body protein [Defluviitaleaceae bacterium]
MGFGGLSIATSGIRVAQRNLNVTGHNISNAETPGFSRQRIVQKEAFVRNVGVNNAGSRMIVGMGANWSEVHQIRNEFLDVNFRRNVTQLQFYSTRVQAGLAIETLLGELHGSYNFQSVINNMWYAIQELTAHPEGLATRQFFLSTANTFLTKSQTVFDGLLEQQFNLDMQIREMVNGRTGVNETVAAIADLNRAIQFAESGGERANDFRDQRHMLLDHLATLIPIDVFEEPSGNVAILTKGHHLLSGNHQSLMGLRYISPNIHFVEPVFTPSPHILSAGTPPDEFTSFINYLGPLDTAMGAGGQLLALMQARGTLPANHMSADVAPPMLPDEIHRLADEVEAAIGALGGAATGNFMADLQLAINAAPAGSVLREDLEAALAHAQRDANRFIQQLVAAAGNPVDIIRLTQEIERDFLAQTHNHRAHMWSIEHAMIPQVQMNLDRIVNSMITMINDAVTGNLRGPDGNFLFFETNPDGTPFIADPTVIDPITGEPARTPIVPVDARGNPGIPLFVRYMDIDDGSHTWPLTGLQNPNMPSTIFTAANIRLNPDFHEHGGHNLLALSLSGAPGDTDLLVALHDVWMSPDSHYAINIGGRSFNVQDAYLRFTGTLAADISESNSRVTTQTTNVDQSQNLRMAIKGVSMDEELNAMLRFQFAFQAASRVFNMIDGMIDRIVNGTGRVGL